MLIKPKNWQKIKQAAKDLLRTILSFASCICLFACHQQSSDNIPPSTISPDKNQVKLSASALKSAQIEIITVKSRPYEAKIVTTGEIKADENRVFHINSIVAGRVVKDNVALGQIIKRNDQLATIQNLEVVRTYSDYIHQAHQNAVDIAQVQARLDLAKKDVQRLSRLRQEGIVAEKDLLAADSKQKILEIDLAGFKEHDIHIKSEATELLAAYGVSLDNEQKQGLEHISSGSPLIAPKSGVVIQKNVTVGDVVNPSQILYVVADLSQVWLDITVYDKDLGKIKEGQQVLFHSDSLPGSTFTGIINYIQPLAGDTTRTFLARVILPNPDLRLKPGMFGQAEIIAGNNKELPYLPDKSLQKYGNQNFVFVQLSTDSFEKRPVTLGNRTDDGYLATNGIASGERVVGIGSFKLKSELMKSEIGNDE